MSGDQPTPSTPQVLWAQRKDILYVTISLGDVKDKVINVKDGSLHFRGKSGTPKPIDYEVNLEFYSQVDPESVRQANTCREIFLVIKKKESGFWPRLLSTSAKQPWLRVDFNRWKDEDESEPEFGGMDGDFSRLLSGMSDNDVPDPGMDDFDSDDDGKLCTQQLCLRASFPRF
ncbi:unnamed protein product [Dicrocoelium dendriticum]|nr:unnamed protein product [Dicrocoelium dendriticum]